MSKRTVVGEPVEKSAKMDDESGHGASGDVGDTMEIDPHRSLLSLNSIRRVFARHLLILRAFAPSAALITGESAVGRLLMPLFCFDPAQLGMYLNVASARRLKQLAISGFNIHCKGIKGSIKLLGINAPFVTNTAGSLGTNSQLTLVGFRQSGMENTVETRVGLYGPPAPTVDSRETNDSTSMIPEERNTAGSWTEAGFGWNQYFPKTAAAISAIYAPIVQGLNDLTFRDFNQVASLKCPASGDSLIARPAIGDQMDLIEFTNQRGTIMSWDHSMNECLLHGTGLAQAPDSYFPTKLDPVVKLSNGAIKARESKAAGQWDPEYLAFDLADRNANLFYLTHHNAYPIGTTGVQSQRAIPKEYLYISAPPTIDSSEIQQCFLQVAVESEMFYSIDSDDMFQWSGSSITDPGTSRSKMLYLPKETWKGTRDTAFGSIVA